MAETLSDLPDLMNTPLLYSDDTNFLNPACDWPAWFRAAGLDQPPPTGTHFNQADHAIDAALGNAGVVLGRVALAQKALSEGRLVAPFETALSTEAHFRVLCPSGAETRPHIATFLAWIRAEVQKTHVLADTFKIVPAQDVLV